MASTPLPPNTQTTVSVGRRVPVPVRVRMVPPLENPLVGVREWIYRG